MITLDTALDAAMSLSFNDRLLLVDILSNRLIHERRKEIAFEIKEATDLYNSGALTPTDAKTALEELHNSLLEKLIDE